MQAGLLYRKDGGLRLHPAAWPGAFSRLVSTLRIGRFETRKRRRGRSAGGATSEPQHRVHALHVHVQRLVLARLPPAWRAQRKAATLHAEARGELGDADGGEGLREGRRKEEAVMRGAGGEERRRRCRWRSRTGALCVISHRLDEARGTTGRSTRSGHAAGRPRTSSSTLG